jgi:plastocyanin
MVRIKDLKYQYIARKRAVSRIAGAAVVVAILIIAILGISYIVLVLPGSTGATTTNTSTTSSISISPQLNLPSTYSDTNVYIPSGAAIDGSVANFNPQNVTVAIGVNNTVFWINLDNTTHIVEGANGSFMSDNITLGASWNYTFTTAGVYPYSDPNYGWLNGTVTVVS